MKRLLYMAMLVLLTASASRAQTKQPLRFESYNALGVVTSSQSTHGLVQTVNGVSLGRVYAGLGLGIDFYRVRSVPLFIDLKYRWGKGRNQWFVYGDGGYNFPWDDESDVSTGGGVDPHFDGGFYGDLGLGYQRLIGKRSALFFTAGYSEKYLSESYIFYPVCPGPGNCPPRTEFSDYRFRRYGFKVGWKF